MDIILCYDPVLEGDQVANLTPFADYAALRYQGFGHRQWSMIVTLDPVMYGSCGGEFDDYDRYLAAHKKLGPARPVCYLYYRDGKLLAGLREIPTSQNFISEKGDNLSYMIHDMWENARRQPDQRRLNDRFNFKAYPALAAMIDTPLPHDENIVEHSRIVASPDVDIKERRVIIARLLMAAMENNLFKGYKSNIAITNVKLWHNFWEKYGCKPKWYGPAVRLQDENEDDFEEVRVGGIDATESNLANIEQATQGGLAITEERISALFEKGGGESAPLLCYSCFPDQNELIVLTKNKAGQRHPDILSLHPDQFKKLGLLRQQQNLKYSIRPALEMERPDRTIG